MARYVSGAKLTALMKTGHLATQEDRERFAQLQREKAARRREAAEQRAERERRRPEREAEQTAWRARREAVRKERESLQALSIGESVVLNYTFTSQLGPMLRTLRIVHGLYFTSKSITGGGVRVERINPPHAPAASDSAHADLL